MLLQLIPINFPAAPTNVITQKNRAIEDPKSITASVPDQKPHESLMEG